MDKNVIYAIAHIVLAFCWGPLSWVICHDIVNYLVPNYEHIIALKWGISSSGVVMNGFMFTYRYSMIEDDKNE